MLRAVTLLGLAQFIFCNINEEPRVVILGSHDYDIAKWDLIDGFFPHLDFYIDNDDRKLFTSIGCEINDAVSVENIALRPQNSSCIIISSLSVDQMSLDDIGTLFDLIRGKDGLAVVELGEKTVQLHALLAKNAGCWGVGKSDIAAPNRVYLCNQVHPNHIPALGIYNVRNLERKKSNSNPQEITFWPCIFASAAKAEKHSKSTPVDDIRIREVDDDDDDEVIVVPSKGYAKKLLCKYRKSCYESGVIPNLAEDWKWHSEKKEEEKDEDDNDDETDEYDHAVIVAKKLKCKYRKSCYEEHDIPLKRVSQTEDKEDDEKDKVSFFSGKLTVPTGKKRTVKEIAEKTVHKVKRREEDAKDRVLPSSVIVERKLEALEKEQNRKLACKYRKSCYETGKIAEDSISEWYVPAVFHVFESIPTLIHHEKEDVNISELHDLERKYRCKYRKSCIESGILPEIDASPFNFDVKSWFASTSAEKEIIIHDDPSQSLQIRCKYRLSCYETGILPELGPQEVVVSKTELESEVPSSTAALKHFCKYRKSCYEKLAISDGISAIKEIRKQRLVEKVKLRRTKRRRVLDEEGLLRRKNRRDKLAAQRLARQARKAEKQQNAQTARKDSKNEEPKKTRKTEKDVEKKDEEIVDDSKNVEAKSGKKQKAAKVKVEVIEEKEEKEEVQEVKEEPVQKPKKKKTTKVEAPKEEEPKDETKKEKTKKKKVQPIPDDIEVEEISQKVAQKEETKPSKKDKTAKKVDKSKEEEEELAKLKKEKKKSAKAVKEEDEQEAEKIKEAEKPKKAKKEDAKPKAEEKKSEKKEKKEKKAKHEEKKESPPEPSVEHHAKSALGLNTALFETLEQQRMTCKYRKSCYNSGKVPEIDRSYLDVLDDFNKHVEKQYETELEKHIKEDDKKLQCKYRKSCYNTGHLPKILNVQAEPVVQQSSAKFSDAASAQLKCKYRKSCYAKHGLKQADIDEGDKIEVEEKEESFVEKKTEAKKAPALPKKQPSHGKDHKKKGKKPDSSKEDEKDDDDEDDEKKKEKDGEGKKHHLSPTQKLRCKYRESCYEDGILKQVIPETQSSKSPTRTHVMTPRAVGEKPREHCHPYWLSCREWLGLPPKEKAPIGPNGKRLCRKKKPSE